MVVRLLLNHSLDKRSAGIFKDPGRYLKEISKSWRAKAHLASLALVGVEAVRKVKGL